MEGGAIGMLNVGATCAGAGIIVGVVTLTGLGLKFSSIVIDYAGGSLLLTAIFTSLVVWIVGLAVPVTASYIICAVIAAPALIKLGVPDFAAHMFIFYYAVLSEVSPPTALSPFAAAAITGGDPYKTTMQCWKYTVPAFLLPFMFVLDPAGQGLLLMGSTKALAAANWWSIGQVTLTAALGIAAHRRRLPGLGAAPRDALERCHADRRRRRAGLSGRHRRCGRPVADRRRAGDAALHSRAGRRARQGRLSAIAVGRIAMPRLPLQAARRRRPGRDRRADSRPPRRHAAEPRPPAAAQPAARARLERADGRGADPPRAARRLARDRDLRRGDDQPGALRIPHHAPLLRAAGASQAQVDALADVDRALATPGLFDSAERATIQLALEMTRSVEVADATFAAARSALGDDRQLVELIGTIASYNMVSRVIVALGIEPE